MGVFLDTMTNGEYSCHGGGRDTFIGRAGPVISGTGHNIHRDPSTAGVGARRYTGFIPTEGAAVSPRGGRAVGYTPRYATSKCSCGLSFTNSVPLSGRESITHNF